MQIAACISSCGPHLQFLLTPIVEAAGLCRTRFLYHYARSADRKWRLSAHAPQPEMFTTKIHRRLLRDCGRMLRDSYEVPGSQLAKTTIICALDLTMLRQSDTLIIKVSFHPHLFQVP